MKSVAGRKRLKRVTRRSLTIVRDATASGFVYRDRKGRKVGPAAQSRIEQLAIPPAWTEVSIAPQPNAHLQAVGRDEAGRWQYVYHDDWTDVRDRRKLRRLLRFGEALPRLRARARQQLRRRTLDRDFALAIAVTLLDEYAIRAGHEQYARASGGIGCATLRKRNLNISGDQIVLAFSGKGEKPVEKKLDDRRLATAVRRLLKIPGPRLLQYIDADGQKHCLRASAINRGIRDWAEAHISAKDFRTFAASARAFSLLFEKGERDHGKPGVRIAMKSVAEMLANTPAVTRSSYVPNVLVASYLDDAAVAKYFRGRPVSCLSPTESALLRFLRDAV